MSRDLSSPHGHLNFNNESWRQVLVMAINSGWEPVGTILKDDADWDGSYFFNEHQFVTDEDARNLADAIERALPDVPDIEVLGDKITELVPGFQGIEAGTPINPFEWFGGQKERLREFIAFCRAGGFRIG